MRPVLTLSAVLLCALPALAVDHRESVAGDGSDSAASPTAVGLLSPGMNTISGSASIGYTIEVSTGFPPVARVVRVGDNDDVFTFDVPVGRVVTDLQVTISNLSSNTLGSASVTNTSAGISGASYFTDTTFTDLITTVDGTLPSGRHQIGINANVFESILNSLSFNYEIRITVSDCIAHDEAVHGDISSSPYDLGTLCAGVSVVDGRVDGSDYDTVRFTIPDGAVLTTARFEVANFTDLTPGSVGVLYRTFPAPTTILDFIEENRVSTVASSLPAGTYEFQVASGDRFDYQHRFTVESACPCEFTGDFSIDVEDLLAYLSLWFMEDGAADLNGGGTEVTDLLAFLSCWFPVSSGAACG